MLERLHEAIAAVCPIDSARVGNPSNRSTWGFDPSSGATPEQVAAGHAVLRTFDASPDAQASWEDGRHPQRRALRQAAVQAIADNDAFLALGAATGAQVLAQVRRLTQQSSRTIQRLIQVD